MHWLLYGLLMVQPIIGWIATSAYRAPVLFFWTVPAAADLAGEPCLSEQLFFLHDGSGFAIAALLCAHIGGALFHYFIRKDACLHRMING